MKKTTKAVIATGVAAVGIAAGSLFYSLKTSDQGEQQIIKLEQELKEKEAKGEGTTLILQKINQLKSDESNRKWRKDFLR